MEEKEKDIFSGIGQRYWWVNEESKAVLNRGYLLQGETIESAINRITNSVSEWYNLKVKIKSIMPPYSRK